MKCFIQSSFGNSVDKPVHCHSFYTCQGSRCNFVTQTEMNQLWATSHKGRFQHQWILDKNSFCKKTGLNWLVYVEGRGMFCLLCRKHDATNLQNKSTKFNTEPAVIAIIEPLLLRLLSLWSPCCSNYGNYWALVAQIVIIAQIFVIEPLLLVLL